MTVQNLEGLQGTWTTGNGVGEDFPQIPLSFPRFQDPPLSQGPRS